MALTLPGTPYVEASDLVAAYPAASENLADRVDLVGVLPFADSAARATAIPTPTDGQFTYLQDTNSAEFFNGTAYVPVGTEAGLEHINTTSFSAVNSVSLNNVFTATFDNYYVLLNITAQSSNPVVNLRYRLAGADNTTSNYNRGSLFIQTNGGTTGFATSVGQTTLNLFNAVQSDPTNSLQIIIFSPAKAVFTPSVSHVIEKQGGGFFGFNSYAHHGVATAFDGFSILASVGDFTGIVRTYGYKN